MRSASAWWAEAVQPAGPSPIPARWFDGRSSQAQKALISLQPGAKGPALLLHTLAQPGAEPRRFEYSQVGWPEAWSAKKVQRTVTVDLREAGSLEIDDVAQWQAMLAGAGARAPLAERMQTRWRTLLVVFAVAAVGLWAFYRWGTPWAATQLTRYVPLGWETSLSQNGLAQLEGNYLKPSKLPAERQAQLRQRFQELAAQVESGMRRYDGYAPPLTLLFRSGLGANAFALPGGTIVMTDDLVQAAAKRGLSDDALLGVLAHELGHVMHRHTTRIVVEQGVLNVGLGLAMGDLSTVVSMGSSLLTGLAYRRGHETEADCFALALMQKARMPVEPMADLLLGIDGDRKGGAKDKDKTEDAAGTSSSWANLLSSHPDTRLRAERLKRGQAEDCRR
jgi:Zn-dependent protease with chaperone function